MTLLLKKLEADCSDRELLDEINREAFPEEERLEMSDAFAFSEQADGEILGIYGSEGLVGFLSLIKNEKSAYICYFAIKKTERGKGWGTETLRQLFARYPDIQITLDFEPADPAADNYPQRLSRKAFYLRNGLHETGYYTRLMGNYFEVVCNGGELNRDGLCGLLAQIHAMRAAFSERLFTEAEVRT